jgi:hypothetical protein
MRKMIKSLFVMSFILGSSFVFAYDLDCKGGIDSALKPIQGTFKGPTMESYEGMVGDVRFEASYDFTKQDISLVITDYVRSVTLRSSARLSDQERQSQLVYTFVSMVGNVSHNVAVVFKCNLL